MLPWEILLILLVRSDLKASFDAVHVEYMNGWNFALDEVLCISRVSLHSGKVIVLHALVCGRTPQYREYLVF